jgi:hypothetical protein
MEAPLVWTESPDHARQRARALLRDLRQHDFRKCLLRYTYLYAMAAGPAAGVLWWLQASAVLYWKLASVWPTLLLLFGWGLTIAYWQVRLTRERVRIYSDRIVVRGVGGRGGLVFRTAAGRTQLAHVEFDGDVLRLGVRDRGGPIRERWYGVAAEVDADEVRERVDELKRTIDVHPVAPAPGS